MIGKGLSAAGWLWLSLLGLFLFTAEIDTEQRTSMDGAFIELAAKCGRDQPGRKGDQERTGGE